ncbi:MAG: F0F1 ATP synthase subunit gamma [Rhodospirillales bacterium]
MANLKDLRIRIASVKSTQKITAAMKMVAASKLRRGQEAAEEARPYVDRMGHMMSSLLGSLPEGWPMPKLMAGTGEDKVHLLVPITADRGLCGGFNGSIVRATRQQVAKLTADGKTVKIFCIGRKARDLLRRDHADLIIDGMTGVTQVNPTYASADEIGGRLLALLEAGEFDVCTLIFNTFKSAIAQILTRQQLIPVPRPEPVADEDASTGPKALHIMEPSEAELMETLLPRNLSTQIFRALLESYASEQGARMSAMDNATRNAGDMIDNLTLTYNRTRQAVITSELIEIISGAEAI